MTYHGRVSGGQILLEEPLELAEGVAVRVEVESLELDEGIESLLSIPDLAVETGIPDLAENIDHYLYGHPKEKLG
ncbi:MAG TPA: hypothetical protein VF017_13560 [Thermoanaerobaculia bacterium]|nr:hypothetical protein [Thermoanaerobaculia bacterium]